VTVGSSGCLTFRDIGTYVQISVYPDIGPDIGTIVLWDPISVMTRYREIPDIGYNPISGITQYRVIPDIDIGYDLISIPGMTRYREIPDIGFSKSGPKSATISGYTVNGTYVSDQISGHILPDIVSDIMTHPRPVLVFPAAAAAASAAAYSMLRNPCY
jgi:hypothetical protein